MNQRVLARLFAYHRPPNGIVSSAHELVRSTCHAAAGWLNQFVPESPEKEQAIRGIQCAMFWANAAVALNPEQFTPPDGLEALPSPDEIAFFRGPPGEDPLLAAAQALLEQNGGPTDTVEGDGSHVLVRFEDFQALERAVAQVKRAITEGVAEEPEAGGSS